jgi:hypothetical protein
MGSRASTGALLAALVFATAILGFALQGGGGALVGGRPSGRSGGTSGPNGGVPPTLVVEAATVASGGLYGEIVQTQHFLLVPLAGLRFTLTGVLPGAASNRHPPTYFVFTNSSGVAETALPGGNYTVQAAASDFYFEGSVDMIANQTTTLSLQVVPEFMNVTSLVVMNQDTVSQVEPTATIYARVQGEVQITPSAFYQVVGLDTVTFNSTTGFCSSPEICVSTSVVTLDVPLSANVTAVGGYPAPGGTWVLLAPSSPYQPIPQLGVRLVQYITNSTVTYSAG